MLVSAPGMPGQRMNTRLSGTRPEEGLRNWVIGNHPRRSFVHGGLQRYALEIACSWGEQANDVLRVGKTKPLCFPYGHLPMSVMLAAASIERKRRKALRFSDLPSDPWSLNSAQFSRERQRGHSDSPWTTHQRPRLLRAGLYAV